MLSHSPLSPLFIPSTLYSVVLNMVLNVVLNVVLSGTQYGTQWYLFILIKVTIGAWYDTQSETYAKLVLVLSGTQCCTQLGTQLYSV